MKTELSDAVRLISRAETVKDRKAFLLDIINGTCMLP